MRKNNAILRKLTAGFTIMELIIVVILIALLTSVAYPRYIKAMEKSKVGEAMTNLFSIRMAEKVYFIQHGTFTSNMADLSIDDPNSVTSRYFYYESVAVPDLTVDFKFRAVRGGSGAVSAPSPYNGDIYMIQQDGEVRGRFTNDELNPT